MMFIHMQTAKEKQNLLLDTFEKKNNKARFECYLLTCNLPQGDFLFPLFCHLYCCWTASLAQWSACLTINHEVAGLIPGTSTILNVD